ncbi:MAG: nicotinate phosphoribosyltransferase, partial [Proteobacteria bacterium]|nr:nicotinate phosphoribosyltransferase [Pseudomonadota bacterium]
MEQPSSVVETGDFYKMTHPKMKDLLGLGNAFAYFESRQGAQFSSTLFFGMTYYISRLTGQVVTRESVDRAYCEIKNAFGENCGFPRDKWMYIVENHGGKLPVIIKSVPEGTLVPCGNVLFTVESTDENCGWLVGYLETFLSKVWYTSTVATLSHEIKKIIRAYTKITSDMSDEDIESIIKYKLHDFGARGVSSEESAMLGGLAHLVNFVGTDTLEVVNGHKFYNLPRGYASSVPATEHSVMTAFGPDGEFSIVDQLIKCEEYKDKILSLVVDSYNVYKTVEHICKDLRDDVLSRTGKIVLRPDSGNPLEVIMKFFEIISEHIPPTINSKGFKVLDQHISVIYGDGLNLNSIDEILNHMVKNKWCASNITFGMGAGLLQKVTRDTQRCAYKVSACQKKA